MCITRFTARLLKSALMSVCPLLLAHTLLAQAPADKAIEFAETITAADLEKHLRVLAADDMQGRETGTPGQKKAAAYLAKQYTDLGLKAINPTDNGQTSYYQPFSLYRKTWGAFYLRGKSGPALAYQKDFIVNGIVNVPTESVYETVFAGYGIDDPAYSDYATIDVRGRAVVILDGEPRKADGTYWIGRSSKPSKWSETDAWRSKVTLAKDKGASHILIVSAEDAAGFRRVAAERSAMMGRFNRLGLKPVAENTGSFGTFLITAQTAVALLGTTDAQLKKAGDQINRTGKTDAGSLKGEVHLRAERKDDIIQTENVMGLLEGTDKASEVLVISGHYDHIGVNADGQVNNGANDDGSGTVSVLEIAEAFVKAKAAGNGPRRSVLFLTVVGEEKGLLGSQYYADMKPALPLENTVADLNIDMVGRVDDLHAGKSDNYIYLIGSDKLSSELHAISEETNGKYIGMELDYKYNDPKDPERIYYRSDHYNFAKHKIPIIFYFNGLHADYHRPGDDVEKIDFNLAQKTARLVFLTAWEIANREKRLAVDSSKP
jgi:hypothetical protein